MYKGYSYGQPELIDWHDRAKFKTMKATDFIQGMRVRYIPGVAQGDKNHEACEDGTVSSNNGKYVFVKFDKQLSKFGWEGTTSQCCDSETLTSLPIHTN